MSLGALEAANINFTETKEVYGRLTAMITQVGEQVARVSIIIATSGRYNCAGFPFRMLRERVDWAFTVQSGVNGRRRVTK